MNLIWILGRKQLGVEEERVMRIDKFLKVSRLIKRRTIAKDACEKERILINGKTVKPGSELKIGDIITVQYGNATINAKVLSVSEHCSKEQAESMYEIVD